MSRGWDSTREHRPICSQGGSGFSFFWGFTRSRIDMFKVDHAARRECEPLAVRLHEPEELPSTVAH